ncbi:MAG: hypothetical protein IPM06_19820 [Rhizobiales bacterium]|nr:hypothetical protein [Hyphomicrobiales bacterium]
MAVKLADATAYISADSSNLDGELSGAEGKVSGMGGRMGSVLQGIGMSVGMGIANIAADAVGKVVAFMGDSVTAASDLNETMSKTGVVFGDSSAAVMAWAENAATALGQSRQGALDAASTFGNLFVSMGMGAGDSADMSMGLTQLASDLASFNNIDPTVALEKLRAGMLGQSEPMQALGVNMTAAAVTARALEMGLAATTDTLTPAMLAQARYSIILDQTKTAQGDFARTSDGLANQQRIMDSQWQDMSATVGQALLPVQLALVQTMNDLTQRVLPPLAAFIGEQVVPAMEAIASVIRTSVGPMIEQAMAWFNSLGSTMDTQTNGPMNVLAAWFTENMPRIQQIVTSVLQTMQAFWDEHGARITSVVQTLFGWLTSFWDTQFRTILNIVQVFLQLFTGDFEGAGQTVRTILNDWRIFFTNMFTELGQIILRVDWGGIGRGIIDGIIQGIRNGIGAIGDAARDAAEEAKRAAMDLLGIHSPSAVAAKEIGLPFAQGIGVGISTELQRMSSSVATGINGMLGSIQPAGAGAGATNITININGYQDGAGVGAAARGGVLSALRAKGQR